MRKFISLAAAFIILGTALESCVQGVRLDALSEELQVDVTGAQVESWSDSHGGAGNDGLTLCRLSSLGGIEGEISSSGLWKPLPVSDPVRALLYGLDIEKDGEAWSYGPYINENGQPVFPDIEHGWYLLIDRNSTPGEDEWAVITRKYCNVTAALYDSDNGVLYYAKFDT